MGIRHNVWMLPLYLESLFLQGSQKFTTSVLSYNDIWYNVYYSNYANNLIFLFNYVIIVLYGLVTSFIRRTLFVFYYTSLLYGYHINYLKYKQYPCSVPSLFIVLYETRNDQYNYYCYYRPSIIDSFSLTLMTS